MIIELPSLGRYLPARAAKQKNYKHFQNLLWYLVSFFNFVHLVYPALLGAPPQP